MLLLFFEAAKTVRPHGKYLTDHLLSFLVFGGATAEFVMLPQFGNSTFFLLTVLAFVDFVSGITLHVRLRRMVGARTRAAAAPQRAEPTLAPAPAKAPAPDARQDPVLELDHPIGGAPAAHESRRHRMRQSRPTSTAKSSGASFRARRHTTREVVLPVGAVVAVPRHRPAIARQRIFRRSPAAARASAAHWRPRQ